MDVRKSIYVETTEKERERVGHRKGGWQREVNLDGRGGPRTGGPTHRVSRRCPIYIDILYEYPYKSQKCARLNTNHHGISRASGS